MPTCSPPSRCGLEAAVPALPPACRPTLTAPARVSQRAATTWDAPWTSPAPHQPGVKIAIRSGVKVPVRLTDYGRTQWVACRALHGSTFGAALTSEAVDRFGAGLSFSDAHYWPIPISAPWRLMGPGDSPWDDSRGCGKTDAHHPLQPNLRPHLNTNGHRSLPRWPSACSDV
jgi:hypothetical protein